MVTVTRTQAVSPGYIYTVTASYEAIVRDTETDKLLCKANKGSQGMFIAIGGTVSMTTADEGAIITQTSAVSGGARFEVQQTRPITGEEGVIYLIPIISGTDEENEYEEWIWVKGEWERLGTTGVNLSNYATLTDANTYSGNNTFNGLLLKGNSASLGDTSVLNRSEMDARYGRLATANTWEEANSFRRTVDLWAGLRTTGMLSLSSDDKLYISHTGAGGEINLHGDVLVASGHNLRTDYIETDYISGIDALTAQADNAQLRLSGDLAELKAPVISLHGRNVATLSAEIIQVSATRSLQLKSDDWVTIGARAIHLAAIDSITITNNDDITLDADGIELTAMRGLRFGTANNINLIAQKIITDGSPIYLDDYTNAPYIATNAISGIPVLKYAASYIQMHGTPQEPSTGAECVEIGPGIHTPYVNVGRELRAVDLSDTLGANKYGLRITPDSCQLCGIDFASSESGAIVIGAKVNTLQAQSVTIGRGANTTDQQSVTIGYSAEGNGTSVAIGAYAHADDHGTAIGSGSNADGFLSIAIGNSAAADKDATALGCYTIAQPAGIAIGSYCNAEPGLLNLSVGGAPFGARFSMLLYGGDSYDVRDNTGYLKFEIGDTVFNDRSNPGAQTDSVTISKPNLWSALDNAKYRGAQPYAYYDESAINNIPVLEPNSITHIYTSTDAVIDLSGLTLAQHDTSITTAELWIDVTTAGATITWPEDMLWPDELDPTAAPTLTGAETSNKLYAIVVRKQATRAGEFLVASVAYSFEYQIA